MHGIIDSDETPGGCWTLFHSVAVEGFPALRKGQQVEFQWNELDSPTHRCNFYTIRAWPKGSKPYVAPPSDSPFSSHVWRRGSSHKRTSLLRPHASPPTAPLGSCAPGATKRAGRHRFRGHTGWRVGAFQLRRRLGLSFADARTSGDIRARDDGGRNAGRLPLARTGRSEGGVQRLTAPLGASPPKHPRRGQLEAWSKRLGNRIRARYTQGRASVSHRCPSIPLTPSTTPFSTARNFSPRD